MLHRSMLWAESREHSPRRGPTCESDGSCNPEELGILNRVRNINNTLRDALNGFGRSHSSIYPKDPNVPPHKKTAVRRARELAVKDSLNEYLEGYFSGRGWPSDGRSAVCIGGAAPYLDFDVTLEKAIRTRGYEFLGKHGR
jgi:hypothetical protein